MVQQASESARSPTAASVGYRIIRAMLVVLFFWMFWKFGGYIITAMVVRRFGSGPESDAYFFATQTIVYLMVYAPALSVLVPAFIPVFIDERGRRGERAAWRFASTVLTVAVLACIVMSVGLYGWAGPITDTLVGGFKAGTQRVGVRLLNWIIPGAALMVIFLVLRAVLNSYKVFGYPSAAEAAQKFIWVAVLVAAVWLAGAGVTAAAVGLLAGSVGMVGIAAFGLRHRLHMFRPGLPAMGRGRSGAELGIGGAFVALTAAAVYIVGRLLPPGLDRGRDVALMSVALVGLLAYCGSLWWRARGRSGPMARFALLAVPLAISAFFATYREVVTRSFQSFTVSGVYSDIEGAKKISNFPTELVALALSVAMLPYLCELASKKDRALLGDIVTKAVRMLAVGFVPLTVLTLVLADPVCRLVFDRGDRSLVHLQYTALALQITASALIVYAAERVLMQAYFSLQRMWTPALLGIAATLLHVALLTLAIDVLHYDYPTHIFYAVALAYPVSRIVKNAFLLLFLKRHVRVLAAGPTLRFAAKLAVLAAAVGMVAYSTLRWTERAFPYERYRLRKVTVDNFDVVPETWYSVDADAVEIVQAPGGEHGVAVHMLYKRHRHGPALGRRLDHVRTAGARGLSFALRSSGKLSALRIRVDYRDGHTRSAEIECDEGVWGSWQTVVVPGGLLDGGEVASIWWSDVGRGPSPNEIWLDEVELTDGAGAVLFAEDFDSNGWRLVGDSPSPARVVAAQEGRLALRLPQGARGLSKDIAGYDVSGTDRFRCRIRPEGDAPVEARVVLRAPGHEAVRPVRLEAGKWNTVAFAREELGFDGGAWASLQSVSVTLGDAGRGLLVDDVTFRREPRIQYELLKVVHCTLPTLAGLLVMGICLVVLRFEELSYVTQWLRDRGWRRDRHDPAGPERPRREGEGGDA